MITNSHFGNIWPVSGFSAGGLLGNVIFFAVSGFLLYNIKTNFLKWFPKRFFRVYPALAIFTTLTVIVGQYPLNSFKDAFKLFVYPTNYIFLVWLLICYCIFYFVAYTDRKINRFLETTMVVIFFVWILVYVLFYDKDVYKVDNVHEPFILFLYMESMLTGAWFKKGQKSFLGGGGPNLQDFLNNRLLDFLFHFENFIFKNRSTFNIADYKSIYNSNNIIFSF